MVGQVRMFCSAEHCEDEFISSFSLKSHKAFRVSPAQLCFIQAKDFVSGEIVEQ